MIDPHQLMLFIPSVALMALLPGQDVLFVLAQSIRGGATCGLKAMMGILCAFLLVHVLGAAIGLSAIIYNSAALFLIVKYAGAMYLIFLGLRAIFQRQSRSEDPDRSEAAPGNPFTQGFVTNVLNPKVAMFMLAFLPQFVVPSRGNVGIQIVLLGLIWAAFGLIVLSAVAFAGASVAAVRRRSRLVRLGEQYVTGTIFIALGLRIMIPVRG